jgi:hypothetical protein
MRAERREVPPAEEPEGEEAPFWDEPALLPPPELGCAGCDDCDDCDDCPVDGTLADGVCTEGVDGVLTCGVDGVCTCGAEGVCTAGGCGTCGTGTDASGVCGSCCWV